MTKEEHHWEAPWRRLRQAPEEARTGHRALPALRCEQEEMMQIEMVPIESLLPNPANVRRHPPRALESLKASIMRFGWRVPLVANRRTGIIEAGHLRLDAARELGEAEVPVVWCDDDEVTATSFAIAENRLPELSEWSSADLLSTLDALNAEDALDEAVGWGQEELDRLRAEVGRADGESVTEGEAWQGMPEYESEDQTAWKILSIHFEGPQDLEAFANSIGQKIGENTKYIWYPEHIKKSQKDTRWATDES